jgi:hypothetical protein
VSDDDYLASELAKLSSFANTLDSAVRIPFTPIRIGLDAIVGLVPAVGDLAGALMSLSIVYRGSGLGASRRTLAQMLFNVGLDFFVGSVPIIGDIFDIVWDANQRNVNLLEAELIVQPKIAAPSDSDLV